MSRLFIELYLDEDVSVIVGDILRARGFVAITTQGAGKLASGDQEQLDYAISQRTTLLTHNRADFEALAQRYFESGQTHHGTIITVRRPANDIAKQLLPILNSITADEIENQLLYI